MLTSVISYSLQSPWGVASGAIAGHFLATSIAIIGGAFLAKYISEKLVQLQVLTSDYELNALYFNLISNLSHFIYLQVGYLGGGLFLIFAVATFFGVF